MAGPDKGDGVVALDRNRYLGSKVDLFSDVSKFEYIFEPLKKNTYRFEDKVNKLLTKLKSIGAISDKFTLICTLADVDLFFMVFLKFIKPNSIQTFIC